MQLPWDEHFFEIVIPAWQAYLAAEDRLSTAVEGRTEQADQAGYAVLREGGAATFYVHHFTEVVLRARPHFLPAEIDNPRRLRDWLERACTMLRSQQMVQDIKLLGDVADALKHAILTRNLEAREVAANEAVLVLGTGYGALGYGEGKFGGLPQALVLARSGTRALSSILQNAIDSWRRVAQLDVPELGKP